MSFQKDNGMKMLKEAFNEFAAKQAPLVKKFDSIGQIVMVEVQNLLSKGQMPTEKDMNELAVKAVAQVVTQGDVENLVADVQDLLAGEKTSTGIAMILGSLDLGQIDRGVQEAVASLKDPQVGMQVAQAIKQLLDQYDSTELGFQISAMASQLPIPAQFKPMVDVQLDRFSRFLDSAKWMSDEDIAAAVAGIADEIPTQVVSQMLYGATASMSPEAVSSILANVAASLPSPEEAGKMYADAVGISPKTPSNDDDKPKKGKGVDFGFGKK